MSSSDVKKENPFFETSFNFGMGFILIIGAFLMASELFGADFSPFVGWWFTVLALGITFMPLSITVFKNFTDLGWLISKVIGIALAGWLVWYLSSLHILKFTRTACFIVIFICLALNVLLLYFEIIKKKVSISKFNISHIVLIEGIFLAVFVFWLYLKGFNPKAYGTTEKLMDFGFMKAMFKSEYMPPEDLWLAGKDLNYYYVGQFLATYLSKFSGCGVEYGYNFMLMMIAALGFAMPASIIFNVSSDMVKEKNSKKPLSRSIPYFASVISGLAVCFAGNMHYLVFAKWAPIFRNILGIDKLAEDSEYTFSNYWFPNATRYIGYNPSTNDKTIHEFPSYSFVLGDLHAHVINIIFVLAVVAVLYAFLQNRKKSMDEMRINGTLTGMDNTKTVWGIPGLLGEIFSPYILLTGFFIGLFHTTNFWDFPIYFVVAGAVILFSNAVIFNFNINTVKLTALHAVVVLFVSKLVCLPFTLKFHQISTSVMLCENHTPFYQLLILWGLPVAASVVFIVSLIRHQIADKVYENGVSKVGKRSYLFRFLGNLSVSDLFVLIIALCAIGLIIIPEIIYVKDIYSGDYKRANTMFKLTYQSFILLGMAMGYMLTKLICFTKYKSERTWAVICLILLLCTTGYFGTAVKSWFGDTKDKSRFQGLEAGNYLKQVDESDYLATNWINDNIEGRPVMLEVNGNSYTDYCRVSVRTGLPTLLGWKTHEWLWQSDKDGGVPPIVDKRDADIKTIYTSEDANTVAGLISEYGIDYIYVGGLERTKYEEPVNHSLLMSMGEVVYPSDFNPDECFNTTYIIKLK